MAVEPSGVAVAVGVVVSHGSLYCKVSVRDY